jgi:predicted small lipoprotein YifL
MPNSFLPRHAAVAAMLAVPFLVAACGSRGPLDVVIEDQSRDAGADGAAIDAALDAAPDGPGDASDGASEAGPPGMDGGLLACGTCVAQSCGQQLFACFQNTSCQQTLTCAAQKCLSGGTPNLQCVLGCANGDQAALLQLYGVFMCITGTCGSQCVGVLGGLAGGAGGGVGGGGGGDGG